MKFVQYLTFLTLYSQGVWSTHGQDQAGHFLPYGKDAGDTSVILAGNNILGPLELSSPIVLYNKPLRSLYISSDLLISSDETLKEIHTRHFVHFPRFHYPDIPLLAPLWASFRSLPLHYRLTDDPDTLQAVVDVISSRNSHLSDYRPDLALVLTVDDAEYSFDPSQTVKFQAVFSTDGQASFAAYVYENPDSLSDIQGDFQIGFDSGDGVRGLVLLGTNFQGNISLGEVNIFRIDGNCVTGIDDGQVCRLNSQSTGCSDNEALATIDCICNHGVSDDNCKVSVNFTCPVNSTFLRCSELRPMCLVSEYVCDKIADCVDAVDEVPEQCGHGFSLLPFGPGISDDENDITSLTYYEVGNTQVPIVFYGQNLTNIYVSTNGLITFNYGFAESQVQGFPRNAFPTVPLLTPLWTSFIRQDLGILFRRITNESIHLEWAKNMLMQYNSNLTTFQPSVAVIVTWLDFTLPTDQSHFVTHQAVLVSDGKISFAAFIYDGDTVTRAQEFEGNKVAGFDAGDQLRSATIHSPGVSSLPNLEEVNIFRIDGHCITLASADHMCGLNSYAVGCDAALSATTCRCYDSSQLGNCEVDATYTCASGSVPSFCQEAENVELEQCFPERFICNLNAECFNAKDERNCSQNHGFTLFGPGAGDMSPRHLEDSEDAVSITLPSPILFYQQKETQIYVSGNGLVSFREPLNSIETTSFPRTSLPVPLISPLWAHSIHSLSGPIYYRVAQDNHTLSQVAATIVEEDPAQEGYSPSVAVIISWFQARIHEDSDNNVHLHEEGGNNQITFQVVLSSDGNASFASLVYDNPHAVKDLNGPLQVGFDAGDKMRGVNILGEDSVYGTLLQRVNLFRIDGSCVTRVYPGHTCALAATARKCDDYTLSAQTCDCQKGYYYSEMQCVESDFLHEHKVAVGVVLGIFFTLLFLVVMAAVVTIIIVLRRRQKKKKMGPYSQELTEKINIYGRNPEENAILQN